MEHMEMIEKLRQKAGITREEAEDALSRAGWDMLDALVILEREGKIASLTSSVVTADPYAQGAPTGTWQNAGTRSAGATLWEKIKELFRRSVTYSFVVRRRGKELLSLPVLVMLVVVLALFKLSAVALIVGLLCECQYKIEKRGE